MKTHYFKNYKRISNLIFTVAVGVLFLALGVMEFLVVNKIWGVVFMVIGALILIVPQFYLHAGYTFKEGKIRYNGGFFKVKEIELKDVPVLLITVNDYYKQWKGYRTAYIKVDGEKLPVPSLLLLEKINSRDLPMCDTGNNAKICCKEDLKADMYLNFKFLRQIIDSGFSGDIYIIESIYLAYRANFDAIIPEKLKDKTSIFRRTV